MNLLEYYDDLYGKEVLTREETLRRMVKGALLRDAYDDWGHWHGVYLLEQDKMPLAVVPRWIFLHLVKREEIARLNNHYWHISPLGKKRSMGAA